MCKYTVYVVSNKVDYECTWQGALLLFACTVLYFGPYFAEMSEIVFYHAQYFPAALPRLPV